MAFKAGSPLQPALRQNPSRGCCLSESFPKIYFALREGWTLETFSSRND